MSTRKPEWRQQTPRDQMVVVLMSLEGTYQNMRDGVTPAAIAAERINSLFEDMHALMQLVDGKWPEEPA